MGCDSEIKTRHFPSSCPKGALWLSQKSVPLSVTSPTPIRVALYELYVLLMMNEYYRALLFVILNVVFVTALHHLNLTVLITSRGVLFLVLCDSIRCGATDICGVFGGLS